MSREMSVYRLTCDTCVANGFETPMTMEFYTDGISPSQCGWNRDPTLQKVAAHSLAKDMCPDCTAILRASGAPVEGREEK